MGKRLKTLLALDTSTSNTGYAVFKGEKLVECSSISYKSDDWLVRVRAMAEHIRLLDTKYKFDTVAIEATYARMSMEVTRKLNIAQGIIIGSLPLADVIFIRPAQWKNHFGIKTTKSSKREENKQSSLSIAETLSMLSMTNDDEADAYLIGKYILDKEE